MRMMRLLASAHPILALQTGELLSLRINTRWQKDSIIPLAKQKISNVSHCLHGICFF